MQLSHVRCRRGTRLVHPGVILWEDFMCPFHISQNGLAKRMGVCPRRINAIVLGKRAITAETALGLAEAFGIPAHFWMALQADYDIELAQIRANTRPPRKQRPLPPPEDWSDWFEDALKPPADVGDGEPCHNRLKHRLELIESYGAIRPYSAWRHERE